MTGGPLPVFMKRNPPIGYPTLLCAGPNPPVARISRVGMRTLPNVDELTRWLKTSSRGTSRASRSRKSAWSRFSRGEMRGGTGYPKALPSLTKEMSSDSRVWPAAAPKSPRTVLPEPGDPQKIHAFLPMSKLEA